MSDALEAGLFELLGALVDDEGAVEVRAVVEGDKAQLTVTRAGRRERLEVPAPPLDVEAPSALDLDELRVHLAPRGDAVHVYARRRAQAADPLRALVEEGALPPGFDEELLAAALAGHGLLAVGPARALRRRAVRALAAAASEVAHVLDLDEDEGPLRARAERAVALGAEVVSCEVDLDELRRAARAPLDVAWIASVRAPTAEALFAALSSAAVTGHVCVFGYTPDGTPRLVERHAPGAAVDAAPAVASPPPPASAAEPTRMIVEVDDPRSVAGLPDNLPPLPDLAEAPPDDWGAPDDGPGWELADLGSVADGSGGDGPKVRELGSTPPTPADARERTAFEKALAGAKAPTPQFRPRPPSPHPKARELQAPEEEEEDPLGGLTLEPPGAAPEDEP
jgi:hypothetical protein